MKKKYLKLTLVTFLSLSFFVLSNNIVQANTIISDELPISEEFFPDENFRTYISTKIDADKDGILNKQELNTEKIVQDGGVQNKGQKISSLEGIQYFTKLIEVSLPNHLITFFDATNTPNLSTIDLQQNQLYDINLKNLSELNSLLLNGNHLAYIDLPENLPKSMDLGTQTIIPTCGSAAYTSGINILPGGILGEESQYLHLNFDTNSSINPSTLTWLNKKTDPVFAEYTKLNFFESSEESTKLSFGFDDSDIRKALALYGKEQFGYTLTQDIFNYNMEVKILLNKNTLLDSISINENNPPKKEYKLNENLDFSINNIIGTHQYANVLDIQDGTIIANRFNSVTITGYDKTKLGEQLLSVIYTSEFGDEFKTNYNINVTDNSNQNESIKLTKIKISPSFSLLRKNRTKRLSTTISPAGATTELTWSSTNPSIVSVDEKGNVTAHKFGIVTISASDATSKVTGKTLILAF